MTNVPQLSMIRHYLILFLLFDNGPQLDARQVLSRRTSWTQAMMFCLELGGRPASYSDLLLGEVDNGTTVKDEVWTADFTLPTDMQTENDSASPDKLYRECGYIVIQTNTNKSQTQNINITFFTTSGIQYFDSCTSQRAFICEGKMYPTIYLTQQTWQNASRSCIDHNSQLVESVPQTGQFAFITPLDKQLQQSHEVWTSGNRTLHLLTFTGRFNAAKIEKVGGVFDNSRSLRLVDFRSETTLSSICLLSENDTHRSSLHTNGNQSGQGWIQILLPPFCLVFVAVISSIIVINVVRRKRQVGEIFHLTHQTESEIDDTMTDVVYANHTAESERTNDVVFGEEIAEYELARAARRSVSIPACLYDSTYGSSAGMNHVEIKQSYQNTSEDNEYDNKDSLNPSTHNGGLNLYDRANFQDGEPVYD